VSRALATAVVCAVGAVAVGGCETTQDRSAALRAKAVKAERPEKVAVGRPDRDVRIVGRHEVRGPDGAAVVVELRNVGGRALVRVPVALRLTAGGREQYANDLEGTDELLLRVPVLPPRSRVTFVNAAFPLPTAGAKLAVATGAPIRRSLRPARALPVTGLKRDDGASGESGTTVTGVVRNTAGRAQTEVPVYVTVRRGSRVVGAGSTRIAELPAGKSARFEALIVGDGRTGRLEADALPTKLTTRSSR
jgi:hypothetical protein